MTISLLFCILSLRQLWVCRAALKRRLFWSQLALLTGADFFYCVTCLTCGILLDSKVVTLDSCIWFWNIRIYWEFLSCIIEVNIAAGFMAACFHSTRMSMTLRPLLLTSVVLAALPLLLVEGSLQSSTPMAGCTYKRVKDHNWAIVVCVSCLIATTFYVASVVKTAEAPPAIRRRARLRGFTYVLNFWATFGFRAVFNLVCGISGVKDPLMDSITDSMLRLNGAFNVITYMIWMRYTRKLSDKLEALSSRSAFEQWVIDHYFDLDLSFDEATREAQQETALCVATLHEAEVDPFQCSMTTKF